jgi:hypothetical protein
MDQFDQMEASLLYCPKCRQATPVRKRLLLVLSEGEKFDYICVRCGTISGDKLEKPPTIAPQARARVPMGMLPPPPRRRM